jgi:phosphate starvation-inducible protein PhoH and related proteins
MIGIPISKFKKVNNMGKKRVYSDDDINIDEEISKWEDERKNKETVNMFKDTGINIKCRGKKQKEVLQLIDEKDISIVIGPPGTGKTYLACAKALKFVKDNPGTYKKITLIKSVNVPKDEEIGYLKGTMEEKMEMYMYPFISNFEKIIGKIETQKLRVNGIIDILPIKFALGVTLDDSIVIIDEAQQISKDNLRTLMTRIGQNTKIIFLGDVKQKSVNKYSKSALELLIEHFHGIEEMGCVELGEDDVVRHPIIKKIIKVFERIEKAENLNGQK